MIQQPFSKGAVEQVPGFVELKPLPGFQRRYYSPPMTRAFIIFAVELELIPDQLTFCAIKDEATQRGYGRLVFSGHRAQLGPNKLLMVADTTFSLEFSHDIEGKVFFIGSALRALGAAGDAQ